MCYFFHNIYRTTITIKRTSFLNPRQHGSQCYRHHELNLLLNDNDTRNHYRL